MAFSEGTLVLPDTDDQPPLSPLPSKSVGYGENWWLVAWNESGQNNRLPTHNKVKRGGKWCLFVPLDELDEYWIRIKPATKLGLLGYKSICKRNAMDLYVNHPFKVICVFTYDCQDFEDLRRVRSEIRTLVGPDWDLYYKTDVATDAGLLAVGGHRDISIFHDWGKKSPRDDPTYVSDLYSFLGIDLNAPDEKEIE